MLGKSAVTKRTIEIGGRETSVSLEDPFWDALKVIAHRQGKPLNALVTEIDKTRDRKNLSSKLRMFVLEEALNGKDRAKVQGE